MPLIKKKLQNIPIMQEDIGMAEKIFRPSVPHLQGKTLYHKIHHVEPIIFKNTPKGILDRYKKFTIFCDLMQINGIGFLNTIYLHIIFATGSMIKNRKVNNIEDGIKQINKIYLQRGFKITRIANDSEYEPLHSEISDLGISLN